MESIDSGASVAISVDSDSSYHTASPKQGRKRRRASSNRQHAGPSSKVSLPPPPSRARKIIQMHPGSTSRQKLNTTSTEKMEKRDTQTGQGKSKQQTTAGKKTARKTAHSIIERRRRSKMNEEFETLKAMIPACQGQTMHKLSILQAGIEYMRYLERCVADLKLGVPRSPDCVEPQVPMEWPEDTDSSDESLTDEDEDLEAETPTVFKAPQSLTETPTQSTPRRPPLKLVPPGDETRRVQQALPTSVDDTPTSPAPHTVASDTRRVSKGYGDDLDEKVGEQSTLASSVIQEADQEATAALLMLNSDRRYSQRNEKIGGGLRIRDLLSH